MSAGYSGTPLAKKLGIKEGHDVLLLGPPDGLDRALAPLPRGARLHASDADGAEPDGTDGARTNRRFDVILLFCADSQALEAHFGPAVGRLRWDGGLWACWPKKSSPLHSDLGREEVREVGLATGLVDNKVCAVDDDWSALRFVVRVDQRPESTEQGGPAPWDG
ncbi:MAG: hypothetical protein R3253_13935 [Longimicrobiales bacterium]|nr:hypothetical protein [Longimicrobiales bacterium]